MKVISLLLLLAACASNQPHEVGTTPISMRMTECYQKSKSLRAGTEGAIEIVMVVQKDGTTKDQKIDRSEFTEQALNDCALEVLKNASFLPLTMDTTIKQSFHFHKAR